MYGCPYLAKKKLTLSIDEDLVREVKSVLAGEGLSLSGVVEEFLESITASRWLEELAENLRLGDLNSLDPSSIPKVRPKGYDATKIVRELREQRASASGGIFD